MFDLIEKLRKKPDRTKKQVAFLFSFFICGIIFVVWLSAVYPDFKNKQDKIDVAESKGPSPLSTLIGTFSDTMGTIGNQFSQIKNAVSGVMPSTTYYVASTTDETDSVGISTSTSSPEIEEITATSTVSTGGEGQTDF